MPYYPSHVAQGAMQIMDLIHSFEDTDEAASGVCDSPAPPMPSLNTADAAPAIALPHVLELEDADDANISMIM